MRKKIFFLLIFITFSAFSQVKNLKTEPLESVLKKIEQKFNVKFSFSNDLIKDKNLTFNFDDKNIKETIMSLKRVLKLEIKLISKKRYLLIFPPKKITICGILNDENNELIYGATIRIKGTKIGTTSDFDGYFTLNNILTKSILEISYLGYKYTEKSVSDFLFQDCLPIYIQEDTSFLNEISITNYLTNSISKSLDGAIVFKPKNQDVLPGLTEPDVLQTVQQLPGILSVNETASGLHVRGGTPDQNLILFDGIRLFNTGHFFGAISALNPYIIENVTVYRTASNSKYGNHIAGVVDVETSTKIDEVFSGSTGFNFTHADANLRVPISKKMSAVVSFRRSISDIIETPTFKKLANKAFQHSSVTDNEEEETIYNVETKNNYKFLDYNFKLNYKMSDKDYLWFSQIAIVNRFDYNFLNTDLKEKRTDVLEIKNYGYSTNWKRNWSEKLIQNLSLSYSKYNLLYDNLKIKEDVAYAKIDKNNLVTNVEARLDFTNLINKQHQLKYGYQYAFQEIYYLLERENENVFFGNKLTLDNSANNTHTLFSEYSFNYDKKYILNLGLRSNYFSSLKKFTVEPRIFAQVGLFSNVWFNSSFEIKQQNTSKLLEFDTIDFGLENQLWALSNDKEIPLLESNQITLGVLFRQNNWIIDLDIYKRNINGLTTLTTGFDSFIQEIYTGKATTVGLDFLVKKSWKNYTSWISYNTGSSIFNFEDLNNGKEFNGNFDVSHSFFWTHNLKIKNFTFSTAFNYRIGIPFSSTGGQNANFGIIRNGINDSRLPDYHRLDFSATYNFNINKTKTKIGLSLLNVYDKANILKREYETKRPENSNDIIVKNDTKSQGFTPNFFLRVSF